MSESNKKSDGLRQRAITATFIVIVMLICLYFQWTFELLFLFITAGCAWELLTMTIERDPFFTLRRVIGTIFCITPFLVSFYLFYLNDADANATLAYWFLPFIAMIFLSFFLLMAFEMFTNSERPLQNMAYIFFAFIYIGLSLPMVHVLAWHSGKFEPYIVLGMVTLNWLNDTGAYIVGSRNGKTPLFTRISPNKTWEGMFGGLLWCLLTGVAMNYILPTSLSLGNWLIMALLVSVFGIIGDLVESMMKRAVGVKDSGRLMPGHGGLLDRFDAFIFAIPFVTVYLLFWVVNF